MREAELRRLVEKIKKLRGTGTQLISLYIPPGYPASELSSLLTSEYSKAGNIKSKQTRKNVQAALQKIMQFLKSIDYRIPENGLVIFCGNVGEMGESDIKLFAVEPLYPVSKLYRCDEKFYTEPLEEQLNPKEVYGLLLVDKKEATIGILRGKRIEVVSKLRSLVPGKSRAGGQSARRFERLREIAAHEFFKKVGDEANKAFLSEKELKGVLVGGPGPTKNEFVNKDYLDYRLKQKIIGIVDTEYTDEYGLRELIERAGDLLKESELYQEKSKLQRFFGEVAKGGLVVFGLVNTVKALREGRVSELLLSEDFEKWLFLFECPSCGKKREIISDVENVDPPKCDCGSIMILKEKKDLREEILKLAEEMGAQVFFVSPESPEGTQFVMGFGGIGAFLRY